MHGLHYINHEDFFQYSPVTCTRGDKYKIFITRCSTMIRQNSFILRTSNFWNNLLFSTKDSRSINSFKNAVDMELSHLMFDFD